MKINWRSWQSIAASWLTLWLPLTMLALLPTLEDFLQNRYQLAVQDLILPVILDLLLTCLVASIFYRMWTKSRLAGYLSAVLATLILTNGYEGRLQGIYQPLQAILPTPYLGGFEGVLLSLVFSALIFTAAGYCGRFLASWPGHRTVRASEVVKAITIAITVTFGLMLLPALGAIISEWPQFFYKPPSLAQPLPADKTAAQPDVYYIVLDDYANQAVLGSQLGFDNSGLTQWLQANHYMVDSNANSNYPYTTMSVASTLNANYLSDVIRKYSQSSAQTIIPYHLAIKNSSVIQQFKSLGYQYSLIGSWYETTNSSPLADHVYQQNGQLIILGHKFALDNFAVNELNGGWFWRFVQPGLKLGHVSVMSYASLDYANTTLYGLRTLANLAAQPAGGRFIFAHILTPHVPYVFNSDGSLSTNSASDNIGSPIQQKYTNQIQFINDQIKPILSSIDSNSGGQAVVVLQSDEGANPVLFNHHNYDYKGGDDELNNGSMLGWSNQDLAMKYGTLAAYHLPGVSDEAYAAGADPVNIFRLIFNSYFGANYAYLPRCYYAYPDGRAKPFVYADITQRLTGQASPACAGNGAPTNEP